MLIKKNVLWICSNHKCLLGRVLVNRERFFFTKLNIFGYIEPQNFLSSLSIFPYACGSHDNAFLFVSFLVILWGFSLFRPHQFLCWHIPKNSWVGVHGPQVGRVDLSLGMNIFFSIFPINYFLLDGNSKRE